jgi:phosphoribosyl 1,2-cyclic phosphate phosphodiesterase
MNVIQGNLKIGDFSIVPIEAIHGDGQVTGYRFERFAYITDVSEIPAVSLEKLKHIDVLILGALRYTPHVKHFNIEQALRIVQQVKPRKTYFTHMCHDIEHEEDNRKLPAGVEFAFDGLVIEL